MPPGLVPPHWAGASPTWRRCGNGSSRKHWRSCALAPIWGAEETGRWEHQPREARICPHCQLGVEDAAHMPAFDCRLYKVEGLKPEFNVRYMVNH